MMTEQEIQNIMKPYRDEFGASMCMKIGNGGDTKAYSRVYIDDLGVNVIINPNDASFRFEAIIDWLFKFSSNNMSPITNHKHFDSMYRRFRGNLEKFNSADEN